MIINRLQNIRASVRKGIAAGFTTGVILIFLILIGIPINLPNLALFLFFLVVVIFGIRVARQLHDEGLRVIVKNALVMGLVAALMVYLLMALVNRWQARGTDVKLYFEAVDTQTMEVLSGISEEELHPNPSIDPLTGEFEEGEPVRTSPMQLTFDRDTGLIFRFGLTGESWFEINLIIGGLFGFLLLLIGFGMLSSAITWLAVNADLGRYRRQATQQLSGNPIMHWVILILPLIFFGLLWLTEGHGGGSAIIRLTSGGTEVQLLLSFMVILFALVAVRAAQPVDRGLGYPLRLGICLGIVALLAGLGIWRILGSDTYFVAPPNDPAGSPGWSVLVLLVVAAALAVQNVFALRAPERFESQLAGTLSFGVLALTPLYLDQYQNDVMTLVGINILLGLGLNIVVGYAGLLDLGYVAFFALGAYTYAFLASNQQIFDEADNPIGLKFAGNDATVVRIAGWSLVAIIISTLILYGGLYLWRRRGIRGESPETSRALIRLSPRPTASYTILLTVVAIAASLIVALILDQLGFQDVFKGASPFLVGLLAGVIVSGLAGIMLGIPVLRLRGDYLAIVTLGFGEIIRLLFNNLRDWTGGPQGVLQIPKPLPDDASGAPTYLAIVYLVLIGAALVAFFSSRLKQSRIGRAWSAMRSDEDIAQSMGVNLIQTKLTAFAIGAAFAGVGGVLFAARQRNIFPGDFRLDVSIEVLSLVIIGGMGSIPGVIMGAVVLIGIPEVLRELSTYRIMVFGALLVAMVIIRPKGLLPAPTAQLKERARALAYPRKEKEA